MSLEKSHICKFCGNEMIRQAEMFQMVWICKKCGISE